MELKIFNVSHGFCAYLIADNGNVMLFDCGHNEQTGFRPSQYLNGRCSGIEHLIIQNFDQDHVSDLPNILANFPISVLFRNRSVPADSLEQLKLQGGPLTSAMESALQMHRNYTCDVSSPPEFPGIEFFTFQNEYPSFQDTNNLSLVSFVIYDGVGIIFPGDLEKAGWDAMLQGEFFRKCLARVNIFIASHHGRINGYNAAVFDYCKPDIVVISDKEIVHGTQKDMYRKHVPDGLTWNGGPERRRVLTTRSDGTITITKSIGKGYHIATE